MDTSGKRQQCWMKRKRVKHEFDDTTNYSQPLEHGVMNITCNFEVYIDFYTKFFFFDIYQRCTTLLYPEVDAPRGHHHQ